MEGSMLQAAAVGKKVLAVEGVVCAPPVCLVAVAGGWPALVGTAVESPPPGGGGSSSSGGGSPSSGGSPGGGVGVRVGTVWAAAVMAVCSEMTAIRVRMNVMKSLD